MEFADEQAAALKAKAASQGYTLEAWLKKLAEYGTGGFTMATLDWPQCQRWIACGKSRVVGDSIAFHCPDLHLDVNLLTAAS